MLPVAFASSTWTAMLRRIVRTTVASLALIIGLPGVTVTPADAALTTRPAVTIVVLSGPIATDAGPTRTAPVRAGIDASAFAASSTTAARVATGPAVAGPTDADPDSAGPVPGVETVVAADPGGATIARRGPPRA
ncbi:hypothetical protein [Micromonospora sp. NBS 11-29]|uniref:hypothetical protein n=1 Tax=Micromonospora sp. NBS 11-29 TaxID=1960879 RepID=UPI000B77F0A1|nr:hypothetical protein [Micromonospora sp. NBS 11-29]